jgi:hypothetical protein
LPLSFTKRTSLSIYHHVIVFSRACGLEETEVMQRQVEHPSNIVMDALAVIQRQLLLVDEILHLSHPFCGSIETLFVFRVSTRKRGLMIASTTTTTKALLSGWERALLVLPALAALLLGFLLVFLTGSFAAITQFSADDAYIYQLAGAAILGYGVALSIGLFQQQWLAVRLVVTGILVNNLGSLYACVITILSGQVPYSVYLFLGTNLLFIVICSLILVRHRGVTRLASNLDSRAMQIFLIIGAVAAGAFGIFPLFTPGLFTLFHLHINAPFIIREAGAASLGYAVVAVLAQQAKNSQEFRLITVMAAVFNGVGGLVSIPYLLAGNVLLLPWIIAPVGILVMVICLIVLRQIATRKES